MALFDDAPARALRSQLRALDAPRYEVTVRTPDDQVQVAVLSGADLLAQATWLRGQNAAGAQVRLQPADPSGLVLVGPLRAEQLDRLVRDGLTPAVATAMGDDRYEAWVRLAREPLPRGLAAALGQVLNDRYTDGGPYGAPPTGGLAAGFVDPRDPVVRTPEGQGRYVTVVSTSRDVAPGAAVVRAEVLEHMRLPDDYFARAGRATRPQERAQGRDIDSGTGARETPAHGQGAPTVGRPSDTARSLHQRPGRGGDRG